MFEFLLGMLILTTPVTVEYVQPPAPIVREVVVEDTTFHKIMLRSVGENGFSFEATLLTACTIYNRLERGYGNGNIDNVLKAYYASDVDYSAEQFSYVKDNLYRCPTDILYALSYNDILYLGFDMGLSTLIVGNVESCRSYVKNKSDNWQCVYFYSKWYG